MKKSTVIIYGSLTVAILMVAIAVIFFRQDPKSDPSTDTKVVTGESPHPENTQEQNDSQSSKKEEEKGVVLESQGVQKPDLTESQQEALEKTKQITLQFFHLFDRRLIKGEKAIQWERNFQNDIIRRVFTKKSLHEHSPQEIAQYYQRNNMYSLLGKGKNTLLEFKVKEMTVARVDYSKKYDAYSVALHLVTTQNDGFFGAGLRKENGEFKIIYAPDANFVSK